MHIVEKVWYFCAVIFGGACVTDIKTALLDNFGKTGYITGRKG